MQRANVAASSIALSINGDEGGGKSRAEPREFIKKSNSVGEIPAKKFGPNKKRKRTGCFVTTRGYDAIPPCEKRDTQEIPTKSGKWKCAEIRELSEGEGAD